MATTKKQAVGIRKLIIHNSEKYIYFLMNRNQLLSLFKENKPIMREFIIRMKKHRGLYWNLEDLQYDTSRFSIITNNSVNMIVTMLSLKRNTIENVITHPK